MEGPPRSSVGQIPGSGVTADPPIMGLDGLLVGGEVGCRLGVGPPVGIGIAEVVGPGCWLAVLAPPAGDVAGGEECEVVGRSMLRAPARAVRCCARRARRAHRRSGSRRLQRVPEVDSEVAADLDPVVVLLGEHGADKPGHRIAVATELND